MTATAKKLIDRLDDFNDFDGSLSELPKWNHRVLIVEDETAIADAYRDILVTSQNVIPMRRSSRSAQPNAAETPAAPAKVPVTFDLKIVHSAEQAIAEVKHAIKTKQPFTMGFFDVLLGGGMDGIELVKKIHEIDSELYAVFVTAYSDRSVDSIQALLGEEHTSRWDYLNKPFTKGEILQKARSGVALWNLRREKEIKDTRLANMQKQLLENERMTAAAAVARGIGHEFRNIMTLITGRAELAVEGNQTQLKDAIQHILTASYRAADILQRFNFLYSPSDAKMQKKIIHLHQPIDEALLLMKHSLSQSHVKVCWIRKKPVVLEASATSLLQVFVNLFINATHAMGSSGQIDLSVQEIDGKAEVRVRDYGPGMKPDVLQKATDAFFTTKGDGGTGLGLAIAKEIIEGEHDGTLVIQNHEVKGLEVIITFPIPEGGGVKKSG